MVMEIFRWIFCSCSRLQLSSSPAIPPVHYLSPLVLRKELENILETHDPDADDLYHVEFKEKHPILFWNLVSDSFSTDSLCLIIRLVDIDLVFPTYSCIQSSVSNASTFVIIFL